jgi:polysaccharide deacetylase family protein (PEP-CTERM system associated)
MPEAMTFAPPVISVDVEDWPQSTWDRNLPITDRSAANTRTVLRILREQGVRATMFVLGKLAEAFPEIVREIQAEGHEIASHGYGHIEVFKQSPKEFAEDIRRSKDLLESIAGVSVKGYRAPDFSISRNTLWALDVLAEAGFDYDSSIFPIHHPRYGFPEWPTVPVRVDLGFKQIIELPISTFPFGGRNWPIGGGGYVRLLPGSVSRHFARRAMTSAPFVFYCHPYEFDSTEFKQTPIRIPLHVRIHQGFGRRWSQARLKAFLQNFGGQPAASLIASKSWSSFDIPTEATRIVKGHSSLSGSSLAPPKVTHHRKLREGSLD